MAGEVIMLIIYILGIVPAYLMLRKSYKDFYEGEWSIASRVQCLILSLFSWISFLTTLIIIGLNKLIDNYSDKPAKW